ncbi:hypothetical protein MD484_g8708, partial [Candolleomyces efflorescens]
MKSAVKVPATKSSKRARARARLRQKLRQARTSHRYDTPEPDDPSSSGPLTADDGPDDHSASCSPRHDDSVPLGKRRRSEDSDNPEEVISITSSSSESENLGDRPYDKGDSLYRGPGVSRVTTDLGPDRPSSVVTRKMTRDGLAPKVEDSVLELVATDQPRKKNSRSTKKKRIEHSLASNGSPSDGVSYDPREDPPDPALVFGSARRQKSNTGPLNTFIDDMAEVDANDDEGGLFSDQSSEGYESSFIDDSVGVEDAEELPIIPPNPESSNVRKLLRQKPAKKPVNEDNMSGPVHSRLERDEPSTPNHATRPKVIQPASLASPFSMTPPGPSTVQGKATTSDVPTTTRISQPPATPNANKPSLTPKAPWPTPQTPMKSEAVSMRDLVGSASAMTKQTSNPAVKKGILSVDPRIHKHCVNLPEYCEVSNVECQDAFLVGDYNSLPHLTRVSIVPWINTAGDGLVKFSGWGIWCPDMNGATALNALRFVATANDRFVNPSRASPVGVDCKETGNNRHSLMRGGKPLIAVITGFLQTSNVITPSTVGLPQKQISVAFHTQEWDRYLAFGGMATGKKTMWAQYREDALQFTTRPVPETSQRRGSASSASVLSTPSTPDAFALSTSDIIPVYDAREARTIDFDKDLPNLDSFLPRWQGEIPYGSFVVVGHTMVVYYSKHKRWTLACNLQWVIVVGVPPETNTKGHLAYVRTDVVEEDDQNLE